MNKRHVFVLALVLLSLAFLTQSTLVAGGENVRFEYLVIQDVRTLTAGLTTPPGFYAIEVGMYPPGEGRLPVIAEDGHWYDNRILLSKIRVVVE